MTIGNSQNPSAAGAVPESEVTTPSETVDTGTSAENEDSNESEEPRLFTQEEVDAMLQKRLGIEQRKLAREQAQRAEQPKPPSAEPPKAENYKTTEDYLEAVSDWKADHKVAQREQRKQQQQAASSFEDRADKARDKYADIDIIFKDPKDGGPVISDYAGEVIEGSELGPEIAYHLTKHPEDAKRIFHLKPLEQAKELGRIEAALASKVTEGKKPSSAPEPITPAGSRTHTPTYDTTDPRSLKTMSTSEWIAAENKRRLKLLQR